MAAENRHPITFYTANTPNGLKVGIYLHEAGLAHQRHPVDLGAGEQKRPEYLKINPNGKIPAIVDHEAGLTVFESGAILSYLSNKTGHLQPDTLAGQLAVQQWLHFQIGGIGPMLGQLWWFLHGSKSGNEEAIERYRKESLRLLGVVDRRLAESRHLATQDYSIADIAAFSWLRTSEELQLDIAPFEHVGRWLEAIEARPAVKAAVRITRDCDRPRCKLDEGIAASAMALCSLERVRRDLDQTRLPHDSSKMTLSGPSVDPQNDGLLLKVIIFARFVLLLVGDEWIVFCARTSETALRR